MGINDKVSSCLLGYDAGVEDCVHHRDLRINQSNSKGWQQWWFMSSRTSSKHNEHQLKGKTQ